jgi:hypothetical protein
MLFLRSTFYFTYLLNIPVLASDILSLETENSFDMHPVAGYEVLQVWYTSVRTVALLQINLILEVST